VKRHTQVVIVGAGPAGLLLGHSLAAAGIDFVIVEHRTREHVLSRIRAGVLEQSSVDVLASLGLDGNLREHGFVHGGIYLQFDGARHHLDFRELIDRTVTLYGQQRVVADLIEAHDARGSAVYFGASDVRPHDVESTSPSVTFRLEGEGDVDGEDVTVEADFVVGADGFHGVCRTAIPTTELAEYHHTYPIGWLGILADVAPSTDDLIYSMHEDGFALHSMRSSEVSRFYLQVSADDVIDDWSDERIWAELQKRFRLDGWTLAEGPITEKSIVPLRSFMTSAMSSGSLFLVGDAAHIVPPSAAKGLNAAIADVAMLGEALSAHYRGDRSLLAGYSERALRRQWKIQHFSQWMTDILHSSTSTDPTERTLHRGLQIGQLDYIMGSVNAQRTMAEQYTGLPIEIGSLAHLV
jgi:p-hydroxybenzoate 3-monooxygenase